MNYVVQITGVTLAISDPAAHPDGRRRATIQLYDGDTPIPGATIDRPIAPAVASRARVGDRWTVSLQREGAL